MHVQQIQWPRPQAARCMQHSFSSSRRQILKRQKPPSLWQKPNKGAGCNRGRLQIVAGLNYPHMPTRMRRQIQEIKYTAQLYIAKFLHYLGALPLLRDVLKAWRSLCDKLAPYAKQINDYRLHLKEEYLKRVDMYDDFCLEELKRKYKWKAYARRDEEVLKAWFKVAYHRISVLIIIAEYEFLAPCGFIWTCILPLFLGRTLIEYGDPIWWWFCAVVLVFILLKHPLATPLRWV